MLLDLKWGELVSIRNCSIINLPKIIDTRGNLTFIESQRHVPFKLSRVYYLYDVPSGAERGGHAHRNLHQLLVAVAGSFTVKLSDGLESMSVDLSRPNIGLYICPMIWRELENFSSGSVCLVLASNLFHEDDYIREYDEFLMDMGT